MIEVAIIDGKPYRADTQAVAIATAVLMGARVCWHYYHDGLTSSGKPEVEAMLDHVRDCIRSPAGGLDGLTFEQAELIEVSLVPYPTNAPILRRSDP